MLEIKKTEHAYYIGESLEESVARIVWQDTKEDVISVVSTFVDPSLRGQNIAGRLLNGVIEYARENNIKIIPVCSYVVKKMTRNDEYQDVLF